MRLRLCGMVLAGVVCGAAWAADPLEEAAARAALDYGERLKTATRELGATRARINEARTPLAEATRVAEGRIAALETEILRLETAQANGADTQRQLQREADVQRRSLGYLLAQAQETMKAFDESLLPGERSLWGRRQEELQRKLGTATAKGGAPVALAVAEIVTERLARQIGGYTTPGQAIAEGDNRMEAGTFVFVGPDVYFHAEQGGLLGAARAREGREWPTVQTIPGWTPAEAGGLFRQGEGVVALDASGGKALALHASHGTIMQEVQKGGVVGYVILVIGVLALAITVQKLRDFSRLAVDEPPAVRQVLGHLARGAQEEATRSVLALKTTTRELFTLGLRHRHKPKALLEEHLESFVLQQRMLQERRLPLLAVIATSGPLLGLLGTVTGMIKTFTLITVFGTGSAGKLSAGISEALVATKLGLMVAIPALVIHGFLSQRIQKHLAMLDRYALEISTAAEEAKREKQPAEVEPS
ncbi:MAG: MotA/TolQ/ExbB proton channel family protein [Opitutaceae bacterium]|nr:MotA/TolQ/ExbB proton channel family protein [Opitutaceae bacterium]